MATFAAAGCHEAPRRAAISQRTSSQPGLAEKKAARSSRKVAGRARHNCGHDTSSPKFCLAAECALASCRRSARDELWPSGCLTRPWAKRRGKGGRDTKQSISCPGRPPAIGSGNHNPFQVHCHITATAFTRFLSDKRTDDNARRFPEEEESEKETSSRHQLASKEEVMYLCCW